jgi:hypothetical protein
MSTDSKAILSLVGGVVAGAAVSYFLTRSWVAGVKEQVSAKVDAAVSDLRAQQTRFLAASPQKTYPPTRRAAKQKRVLVTGGAGFVGSNLVDVLMQQVRAQGVVALAPCRPCALPWLRASCCVALPAGPAQWCPHPPPRSSPTSPPPPPPLLPCAFSHPLLPTGPHCPRGGQPEHWQAQEH